MFQFCQCDYGYGVFATKFIYPDTVIERSPVIVIDGKVAYDNPVQDDATHLGDYVYDWKDDRYSAIALGAGSIFNHSFNPNVDWVQDYESNTIVYRSLVAINPGQQLFISYGYPTKIKGDNFKWYRSAYKEHLKNKDQTCSPTLSLLS